ncbi:MAG: hypothetical protein C0597_08450 [Marinilabiliales bacterium]|nr:MAG: hypothetical protein C0597_08450 [Marinilabiliales bacterium]
MNKLKIKTIKINILLLLLLNCVAFSNKAQVSKTLGDTISIKLNENNLLEAFEKISKESGYSFAFSKKIIPEEILFTKEFDNQAIQEILSYLLRGTGINFKIIEEQIVLIKKKNLKRYTISGFIRDNTTGEALFQANIFDKNSFKGTVSNQFGHYSLSLHEGAYTLVYSFIGRNPVEKQILLDHNMELSINLDQNVELEEIVIFGHSNKEIIKKEDPLGKITVSQDKIEALPIIMGEPDLVKSIQLIPGIQGGSEANGAIYVRGGGPLQNLFLLDNVPIYNCFHLLGLFSVFNSDVIGNTAVIKGGFSSKYGGRLSSVVDVKTKDGNMKEFKGKASIGLISSKLFLEGPLIKDKTSFLVAGRLGYYFIYGELLPSEIGNDNNINKYHFNDINAKLTHRLSESQNLYVSFYTGNDNGEEINRNEFEDPSDFSYTFNENVDGQNWNNLIGSVGWAGEILKQVFGNAQFSTSQYNYAGYVKDSSYYRNQTDTSHSSVQTELNNKVTNYTGMASIQYQISPQVKLSAGYSFTSLDLKSENKQSAGVDQYYRSNNYFERDTVLAEYNYSTKEHSGYLEFRFNFWNSLNINPGVHLSNFQNANYKNTLVQPRVTSNWEFANNIILKVSYSKMGQHIHLLGATRIKQASDLLLSSLERAPSEESDQYSLGISYLRLKNLNVHVDAYYKNMDNLISFSEGASYFTGSSDWEDKIEIGTGEAKGVEFLIEKTKGKLTGWLGYTFSNTTRKFENINSGERYPFTYDHLHYLNITGSYKINEKFDFSVNWLYHSGNRSTIPQVFYYNPANRLDGRIYGPNGYSHVFYNEKNSYKSPDYHRLDFAINYNKIGKKTHRKLTLSVYNLYNRKNVYISNYGEESAGIVGTIYYQKRIVEEKKLIGIIPSISYTISF